MAKHDQTRNGGRPREEVDPSKIVRPKDDGNSKHSEGGSHRGGEPEDEDDK